jgi:integrase
MSVTIRPYKRGGWEIDVLLRLPNGERHRERCKAPVSSKSAAQRWGEDRERYLLINGVAERSKEVPTLQEFAPRFLRDHAEADRQKPSSIASKETIIRMHLIPALGGTRLHEISSADVQRLKQSLVDKAPKTVNNVLTVLNVLLKKAAEWNVIERVPCTITLVPVTKPRASFHDFVEYNRLVESAKVKGWRTHLIVLLSGEAGLRCGEVVALEWRDVDIAKRQLCVRQSDWCGQLTAPKNGRIRYIPVTKRLAGALANYRHLRSSRVLCKDNGEPLTRQSAWTRVRRAARTANVATGVHILRHTFCSHLAMRGAAGRAIQELAGHGELSVTQRYMHLSPGALDSAIRLLESPEVPAGRGDSVETAVEVSDKATG